MFFPISYDADLCIFYFTIYFYKLNFNQFLLWIKGQKLTEFIALNGMKF